MKKLVLAFLLVSASAAFAQDKPAGGGGGDNVVTEADKTVFQKKTVIDFSDVNIEGELTKPEGSYAISKKKTSFKSLIKVRDNFNPELQKSVDNL